ncbi:MULTISPECIES: DUF1127 domain-containing protein [Inquilinus]|uniref:Uncharacterized protein YjiS (DUF1127 family) n=1 Tax=Inquilinus ginsengisoli TaxID=363840 RepID=A0ABU1JIW3_9PROT|nr:DUF1127 domain-containing protein [Inquilinus ginsengisoli]MDR6288557.1 uncharacterized protein YjiS (DUF1127 family) [Inquilinus ginsengisoli]
MSTRVLERPGSVLRPGLIQGLMQTAALWLRRSRTRRRLDTLSDHELRDLGLDRSAAFHESARPFWKG